MAASEQHLYQTIVLPRKLTTGSIYDYLFCYCPLVGILFEVMRIVGKTNINIDMEQEQVILNKKYLQFQSILFTGKGRQQMELFLLKTCWEITIN